MKNKSKICFEFNAKECTMSIQFDLGKDEVDTYTFKRDKQGIIMIPNGFYEDLDKNGFDPDPIIEFVFDCMDGSIF